MTLLYDHRTDEATGAPLFDEKGLPVLNVTSDKENPHFVVTGPRIDGPISLPDGTVYDVTPNVIEVANDEHAGLLSHLIGEEHERRGTYGEGFRHLCSEDHCRQLTRPVTPADAYRDQQAALTSGAGEAAAANGLAAVVTFVNLHSASPGTTGANELASTRQAVAWSTASSGSPNPSNTSSISISLAASTTATHAGGWSAVTAGTYETGFPLSPTVTTGTSAGTVTFAVGALVISIT